MKRHIILLFLTAAFASLCACTAEPAEAETVYVNRPVSYRSNIEIDLEPKPFSYAEEWENWGPVSNYPAWRDSGFRNTAPTTIETVEEVIALAKVECTLMHNHISVYRDEEAGMWMILFYIDGVLGGEQGVFIDDDGITRLIISYE